MFLGTEWFATVDNVDFGTGVDANGTDMNCDQVTSSNVVGVCD